LVYLGARPLSANFYSRGQAQVAESPVEIQAWLTVRTPLTLVVQDSVMVKLGVNAVSGWQKLGHHDGFALLRRTPDRAADSLAMPSDTLVNGSNSSSNSASGDGKNTPKESATR
jgi:hypothetical protein